MTDPRLLIYKGFNRLLKKSFQEIFGLRKSVVDPRFLSKSLASRMFNVYIICF